MKFSAMLAGIFAALVAAAPAAEAQVRRDTSAALPVFERGAVDAKQLNNLNFKQQDLSYLFQLNRGSLDFGLLQRLGVQNNFNVLAFQDLFNVNSFDVNSLLRFQQLHTVLSIAQTGVFNRFDLAGLNLGGLDLGLINGIGAFDVGTLIDASLVPQIQSVVNTITSTVII
ncbi:hypothetical protein NOR_02295 [Metarhizium rileyi]|uniref:Uncharacterized protein n=1 Tax=Metarhizium rileyi (strain RCEF 4871) TaxID=1649241 RepID=A0A167HDZ1_METRR|nr:hypothetical protein NOR_02295 [Metarhizium rileyi RCEF 4871]